MITRPDKTTLQPHYNVPHNNMIFNIHVIRPFMAPKLIILLYIRLE